MLAGDDIFPMRMGLWNGLDATPKLLRRQPVTINKTAVQMLYVSSTVHGCVDAETLNKPLQFVELGNEGQ